MMRTRQSEGFREQALQKVLERGGRTVAEVAAELGMNLLTLKGWLKAARRSAREAGTSDSPRLAAADPRTAAARLDLLLTSAGLAGEALQAWCRERGIYSHQLDAWRAAFVSESESGALKPLRQERDALKQERDRLERQLLRKDKALAEAAALLVLSKKFQALLAGEVE